jgi:hypothetical protein
MHTHLLFEKLVTGERRIRAGYTKDANLSQTVFPDETLPCLIQMPERPRYGDLG